MRIKSTCRIKWDNGRQCWCVHIGVTIVHFGTMFSCEEWARMHAMPISNQDEINRVKYSGMPIQEGFSL